MEKTRQNGDDLKPSIEVQCEVLDLSTKRLPSATPNSSSSSSLPYSCPSSPPNKTRHRSTSVTCSNPIIPSEVDSRYSTTRTAATTLTDASHRTLRALPGTGAETTYSVGSISPGHARASNDNLLREQTKDALRFVRRVDYSPFSFAQLHGVSPVTHTRAPHFEMPPSIASFPFNAAAVAAAAAVSPFIRGFPGLGQPLLTDVGSGLPLQGSSVHPHMDFASTAAATAFPSYLHRRRRRGHRSSDPTTTPCSPHLSQPLSGLQHSTGPRATDDDCSRESANGRPASSRNSERSHSEEKDPAYLERRRKNNEAAKRSRDARRQKEEEIAARAATLEQENITLKAELLLLRRESAELHSLLYGRVDPQR